jgi:hypothetical protein
MGPSIPRRKVADPPLDCTPAYVPTYDAIFADVWAPGCAASSSADLGKPLSEDVRCMVRQWIAMGAPRQ